MFDPKPALLDYCHGHGMQVLARVPDQPQQHGVLGAVAAAVGKSPREVALRWAVQRGCSVLVTGDTAPTLSGSEIRGVLDWSLTRKEMAQLDALGKDNSARVHPTRAGRQG